MSWPPAGAAVSDLPVEPLSERMRWAGASFTRGRAAGISLAAGIGLGSVGWLLGAPLVGGLAALAGPQAALLVVIALAMTVTVRASSRPRCLTGCGCLDHAIIRSCDEFATIDGVCDGCMTRMRVGSVQSGNLRR